MNVPIALLAAELPGTAWGNPCLVLGFTGDGHALIVETDGKVSLQGINGLSLDWRYDQPSQSWRFTYRDDQDIRGEEIQGDLRDLDGADDSDTDAPGNNEGGDVDTGTTE